jgi:hypothetical protein
LENDTLDVWGIDPLMQEDGIIRWDQFWNFSTTAKSVAIPQTIRLFVQYSSALSKKRQFGPELANIMLITAISTSWSMDEVFLKVTNGTARPGNTRLI